MNKNGLLVAMCVVMLVGASLGCGTVSAPVLNVGTLQEERQSVGLNGASSSDVQLLIGTGELTVSPGADGLLEGVFRYNVKEWKPEVQHSKVGNTASVLVRQGANRDNWGIAGKGARNEWDIRLDTSTPMRLTVGMGAGTSKLDLSGLRLTRLNVDAGASETTIRFNTPNPEQLSQIEVNSGAGKVELYSMGNANFERMSVKSGAGELSLDLNGAWTRSASVEVIAGVGRVTVRVPREVGVKVKTGASPVGKVIVQDLLSADGGYVNEAYATAAIKLDVSLTTGVGELTVTAH
ncbi:MAG: hypothetical protein JW850_06925 [Thermoflexales bacterium]|nr:hypothetical protein [Thermoflexales bacterium]